MSNYELYMRRCLELAALANNAVAPNPMVGCVIEKEGKVVAEGYHRVFGEAHAEVNAIAALPTNFNPEGATLYVNLEPCAHHGKTPPCADLIVNTGFKTVVIANTDPNPKVNGGGIRKLKAAGISVVTDVLAKEGRELNKRFFTFQENKRPYITLKWAEGSNGVMGAKDKRVRITGREAQIYTHQLRTSETAILIGTQTALVDNPKLDNRYAAGRTPIKFVVDRNNVLPSDLQLFKEGKAYVFTCKKSHAIRNELEIPPGSEGIQSMLEHFFDLGINSVLVEGGSLLLQSFLNQRLWDEAHVLTAPHKVHGDIMSPQLKSDAEQTFSIGADKVNVYINNA